MALSGRMNARDVMERSGASVSLRTVERVMREAENLVYGYLKARPRLEYRHVKSR